MRSQIKLSEAFVDVWPEKVLIHGLALIVDSIEDVNNASAEKGGSQVKVVHEAVQQGAEVHHFLGAKVVEVLYIVTAGMLSPAPTIQPLDLVVTELPRAVAGGQNCAITPQAEEVALLTVESQPFGQHGEIIVELADTDGRIIALLGDEVVGQQFIYESH